MQKQKRKTNHIHRAACALLAGLALSLGLLTGCGSDGSTIVVGKKNEKGYSRAEVMVIAMTEKNRYEEVCTDQIWGVSVGEKGYDFETYLKKQIRSFMDELKVMNLLAADRGISLTSEERAAMDRAAAEYFGRLPQSAIDSMGVTEADVQHIYEDYGLAEKLAGQLTGNVALEVSDSEAKVIHVSQIKTSDESEADAFQRAASQEDADFQSCAEEAGLDYDAPTPEALEKFLQGIGGYKIAEENLYRFEAGVFNQACEEFYELLFTRRVCARSGNWELTICFYYPPEAQLEEYSDLVCADDPDSFVKEVLASEALQTVLTRYKPMRVRVHAEQV